MKTKTITTVVCDAILIDIGCELNDSTDIKCGGSPVLGYTFYVSPDEDKENLTNFIMRCIKKYKRPFINMSLKIENDYPVKNLWTLEMIENCIKNNPIY